MEKYVKDGKVAVIVSYGFGGGWSTWGEAESCFDGELAKAIESTGDVSVWLEVAKKNWPGQYEGGIPDCVVVWVDQGQAFTINEYDGSESIEYVHDKTYLVA